MSVVVGGKSVRWLKWVLSGSWLKIVRWVKSVVVGRKSVRWVMSVVDG